MKYTSLDQITRSVLQQKQLPIHYYLQYLKYAADAFRELSFSTLRIVNAKVIDIDARGSAPLPCDFVDEVKVGMMIGQKIRPLHHDPSINRMVAVDAQGNPTTYGKPSLITNDQAPLSYIEHYNDNGEYIGRHFGITTGMLEDKYKIIREQERIQFSESVGISKAYIEYISDGTFTDAASKVDPLAQACIEAYMMWKSSPNANNSRSPEGILFGQKWRELSARKNPLKISDIKRIFKANTKATYK